MKTTIALAAFAALLFFVSTNVGYAQTTPTPRGPGCPYSDPSGGCLQRPNPPPGPRPIPVPNVVIVSATTYPALSTKAQCVPGTLLATGVMVTVKNMGTGWYTTVPDVSMLELEDTHFSAWPTTGNPAQLGNYGWNAGATNLGTGIPNLAPNQSAQVPVKIVYYSKDPAHVTKYPAHPFRVVMWKIVGGYLLDPGNGAVAHGPTVNVPTGCP